MGDVTPRGGGHACYGGPGASQWTWGQYRGVPGSFMLWWRLNTGEKELQELDDWS